MAVIEPAPDPADGSRCPRCGAGFHCGAADAGPCACTRVTLDTATLTALRERYRGCLCLACLAALSRAGSASPPSISA